MKKITKVLAAVLVCAMMAVMLVGCGSGSGKKGDGIYIGGIGPLTGDYANYGCSAKQGAEIAVKEINAAGGIAGMQITLDYQDSQGDPDSAVSAYGKLIDSGMDVSLGGVLSGETASVVAAAKNDALLVLTPTGSSMDAIKNSDTSFRVCFRDDAQGVLAAQFVGEKKLATKVAVFYQSDIDYSVGLYQSFEETAVNYDYEIVEVQSFTDGTKTDFSTQIAAIKDSGADLVFIPIYAAEASTFLTQASGKLDGMLFFGADGLDGILTKVSDTAYAENVMLLTPFVADSPEANVQSFVKSYQDAYGVVPDQFAADGYDAIYVIKAAVEKSGKKPGDKDFNEAVVAAMTQITVTGVTGTATWTADGETVKMAQAMIIHDGVATAYVG